MKMATAVTTTMKIIVDKTTKFLLQSHGHGQWSGLSVEIGYGVGDVKWVERRLLHKWFANYW